MHKVNKELRDLFAEARSVRLATQYGAISYDDAKKRVELILERLNEAGERIAKKYGVKHKKITFQNLGTNF